jgi:hypothetical protein
LQLVLFLVHRLLSPRWRRRQVPPKRRFLQEPHGVTTQKTSSFIVTAVKTSNLTFIVPVCVRGWVNPRVILRLVVIGPVISSEELLAFWLTEQCLIQGRCHVLLVTRSWKSQPNFVWRELLICFQAVKRGLWAWMTLLATDATCSRSQFVRTDTATVSYSFLPTGFPTHNLSFLVIIF